MHVEVVTTNSLLRANCAPTIIHIIEAVATSVCMLAATSRIANLVMSMLMQKHTTSRQCPANTVSTVRMP